MVYDLAIQVLRKARDGGGILGGKCMASSTNGHSSALCSITKGWGCKISKKVLRNT